VQEQAAVLLIDRAGTDLERKEILLSVIVRHSHRCMPPLAFSIIASLSSFSTLSIAFRRKKAQIPHK
jgi:hypothetical protein